MTFDLSDPDTLANILNQIGILLSLGTIEDDKVILNKVAYELGMNGLAKVVFQLENKIMVTHTPN